MAETYTSTVVAPAQIALGAVSGLVVAAILLALNAGLWPLAIIAVLLTVGIGYYLATVSVTVTPEHVTISQGRGEREPRLIDVTEVVETASAQLTWLQCFDIGMPPEDHLTRLSVRPGPTLTLVLNDGEVVRVSTSDPARAQAVLRRPRRGPP